MNNGGIGYILFSNNDRIDYTYDNSGKILEIVYSHIDPLSNDETIYRDYQYSYNSTGNLTSVSDSISGDVLSYSGNGYSLIVNNTTLYSKAVDANQNTVQTYHQGYYTNTGYTSEDIVTVSPTETEYNNSTGVTEKSNSVNVIKNSAVGPVSEIDYNISDTYDFFNRLTEVNATIDYYQNNNDLTNVVNAEIIRNYQYKDLSSGVTSNLVSSYSSVVPGADYEGHYERKYEYDDKGNIKFVYIAGTGNNIIPKEYYEYNSTNQLVREINFEKQLVSEYTYNNGGNIVSKKYYNFSNLVFDESNREILSLGNEIVQEITFSYGNPWKDQLIGLQEVGQSSHSFSYDTYGNPLNYYGFDYMNSNIEGTFEWMGNKLLAFESSNQRIEFEYDEHGYRSKKSVYSKQIIGNTPTYSFSYSLRYLWDNDQLEGVMYKGSNYPEQSMMIVYDSAGSPIGYVSAIGNVLLYQKDLNGNIVGLSLPDGTKISNYKYDAWGNLNVQAYGGNIIAVAVSLVTSLLNPITFNGMVYDYETGLYCDKGRFYSPTWGRYINPESPEKISFSDNSILDANLYLFNNNNPKNSYYDWEKLTVVPEANGWNSKGFNVVNNPDFASTATCSIFAFEFIQKYGSWTPQSGYNYLGMDDKRIASDLFAHCLGKYSPESINTINQMLGDGWILSCSQSSIIYIRNDDVNAWKYEMIWDASNQIRPFTIE